MSRNSEISSFQNEGVPHHIVTESAHATLRLLAGLPAFHCPSCPTCPEPLDCTQIPHLPCSCYPIHRSNSTSRFLEQLEIEENKGESLIHSRRKAEDAAGELVLEDAGVNLLPLYGEGYALREKETKEDLSRKPLCQEGSAPGRWLNFSEWQADTCHYR